MPKPITTEQEWVEAAALAIMRQSEGADSTWDQFGHEGRDYWHGLARAAWPLVEPLVTRAQAVRDLCAIPARNMPPYGFDLRHTDVLRALDGDDERTRDA